MSRSKLEFRVGVHWGPRQETPETVIQRIDSALRRLSMAVPTSGSWLGLDPRSETFVSADGRASLERLLAAGRESYSIGDAAGDVFQGLFRAAHPPDIECSVMLGAENMARGVGPENRVELQMPATLELRTAGAPKLRGMLVALVESFQPRWGWVVSVRSGITFPQTPPLVEGVPQIGWLSYLSRELGSLPRVGAPHRIEEIPGHGAVLVARPQPWNSDDPSHRGSIASLRAELEAWGVLKPDPALAVQP